MGEVSTWKAGKPLRAWQGGFASPLLCPPLVALSNRFPASLRLWPGRFTPMPGTAQLPFFGLALARLSLPGERPAALELAHGLQVELGLLQPGSGSTDLKKS